MRDMTWWYLMRSAGLTAWFFLMLTLMWGTIASGRLLSGARARRWVVDLHPYLGSIGLAALALHVFAAVADGYIGLSWLNVVVPFTAGWRPLGIAAGVVSLWLLMTVEVTSFLRRQLGKRAWHRIHLTSYAMAWFVVLHAILNGTDVGLPIVTWSAFGLVVAAGSLTIWRVLRSPGATGRSGGATTAAGMSVAAVPSRTGPAD